MTEPKTKTFTKCIRRHNKPSLSYCNKVIAADDFAFADFEAAKGLDARRFTPCPECWSLSRVSDDEFPF